MLSERLKQVAVLGAGGKMGRGIALLLLQKQAVSELIETGAIGSGRWILTAVDSAPEALRHLRSYLRAQLLRWAEKNINTLRKGFADCPHLVDNSEMITAYVEGAMRLVVTTTQLSDAAGSSLIFEAILEDFETKTRLYKALQALPGSENHYYLSNTSSIPIGALNEACRLEHKIIGFHFYNPPPMQRLVELITNSDTDPELHETAEELGKQLGKTLVPSNDVAGFIGNGHFLREAAYACKLVNSLSEEHGEETAVYLINQVTQDYLLRPMGIFQLLDYVGIDVACKILDVIERFAPDADLQCQLLKDYLAAKVCGGQLGDGRQRHGIFRYENGTISKIFSRETGNYISLPDISPLMGAAPDRSVSWKAIIKDRQRDNKLSHYFQGLFSHQSLGASLAQDYLKKSREIAENLVHEGVAASLSDVNEILVSGFAHAYGPKNSYY